jgi:hypothetical protein
LKNPIVVEWVAFHHVGWHRDYRGCTQPRRIQGSAQLRSCTLEIAFLVEPFGTIATIGRFLDVRDYLVRFARIEAATRSVLPQKVALVFGGQEVVVAKGEVIDSGERERHGASAARISV